MLKSSSSITFYPCLSDYADSSGTAKGHYFHQDLWVAHKVFQHNPTKHVDFGSRIDGFVAHVAAFRSVEVFDIRPLQSEHQNICFQQVDILSESVPHDYCDSISSLHVIEHIGLGRYGDNVDVEGHIKAIKNIHRILKKGGVFYFSVPMGPDRIEFNAHRVFSIATLRSLLSSLFEIENFAYVDDRGSFHEGKGLLAEEKNNFGCHYGCAIFILRKIE